MNLESIDKYNIGDLIVDKTFVLKFVDVGLMVAAEEVTGGPLYMPG